MDINNIRVDNKSNNATKILLIYFLLFFSGCGIWTDFKTYFNTYYNAKVIFEEAEEKLFLEKNELFTFEEKPIPKNLNDSFNKVIEKTSSILQYSKESELIDEALLMTGKSFYYQQNYSRALRKFNELYAMEESDLFLENKLWIGKTHLQMRDFEAGLNILDEVKEEAAQDEEDEILIEMYKSKIGYLIYAKELELSIAEMNEFFNTEIDDELKAEVLFEMGKLYKLNKDYESAEKVFAQVENYSPSFDVDFSSKFEVATLKGELGYTDESLELLKSLRDEDKFIDNWGEIDLEIGKIFYDRNEIEEALEKFTVVDTTYRKTESAGIAGFYRGEILENTYHDYDSALTFYKVASTSLAPPSIRSAAQKKSRLLDQYIIYHKKLGELKQQLIYLTDENSFIEDSLDYIERLRQDSLKFEEANVNISSERGRKPQFVPKYKQPVRPSIGIDSIRVLNSKNYFELANLLFSEFDDPDSAFYYYNLSLKEHPENPNEAQTYYAIGNYYLVKENKSKADSIFTIIYDKFQFDPIRNEAAKQIGKPLYDFDKDPVEEEYAIAETIYYSKNYNEAINKLFDIYEKHPKSIYASKSLYTIGYILENDLDKPDSAVSIYTLLQDNYRTSEYAKAIQVKLTGYKQDEIKSKLELEKENADRSKTETESSIPENIESNKIKTPISDANKLDKSLIIESEEDVKQLIKENEDSQNEIDNKIKEDLRQIREDSSAIPVENKTAELSKPENNKSNKIKTPTSESNKLDKSSIPESQEDEKQLIEENEDSQNEIDNKIKEDLQQIREDSSAIPVENKTAELSKPENNKSNKIKTPTSESNKLDKSSIPESEGDEKQLIEENEDSQNEIDNKINEDLQQIREDSSAIPVENKTAELSKVVPLEKTGEVNNFVGVSQDIDKDEAGYYVQISSWKNRDIAENEVKKLLDKKYDAFIHEIYVESKKAIYYRVKVGPVNSFQSAKNIRIKLNKY